jgi:hypothetical protein
MPALQAVRSSCVLEIHADQSDTGLVGCHFDYPDAFDHPEQYSSVPVLPGNADGTNSCCGRAISRNRARCDQPRRRSVDFLEVRRNHRMSLLSQASQRLRKGDLSIMPGVFIGRSDGDA